MKSGLGRGHSHARSKSSSFCRAVGDSPARRLWRGERSCRSKPVRSAAASGKTRPRHQRHRSTHRTHGVRAYTQRPLDHRRRRQRCRARPGQGGRQRPLRPSCLCFRMPQVQVQLRATASNDPTLTANYVVTVTPGFVQTPTPETASLPPGGTMQVTGAIAQVNAGSIRWSLTAAPNGAPLGDSYGSIADGRCVYSRRTYTTCTATYTAPRALPPGSPSLYLVGYAAGNARSVRRPAHPVKRRRLQQLGLAKPVGADRVCRDGLLRGQCQ